MQNRYTGDIGDFAKYGLLRALGVGHRLGIAWYLYPDESHNADGKHTAYLNRPDKWRDLDPDLFDGLRSVVDSNRRNVDQIEVSGLLANANFSSIPLAFEGSHVSRATKRANWFKNVLLDLSDCDIVFADPDNGLLEKHKYSISAKKSWKQIPLSEVQALASGRTAVIYHHNTRRAGGHAKEIQFWLGMLGRETLALYWRKVSNRTFFIIHPTREMKQRIGNFVEQWSPCFELHSLQESQAPLLDGIEKAQYQQVICSKTSKSCPECGHRFKGSGWGGIDAHWKANHHDIMAYSEAWPVIKAGLRPSTAGKL